MCYEKFYFSPTLNFINFKFKSSKWHINFISIILSIICHKVWFIFQKYSVQTFYIISTTHTFHKNLNTLPIDRIKTQVQNHPTNPSAENNPTRRFPETHGNWRVVKRTPSYVQKTCLTRTLASSVTDSVVKRWTVAITVPEGHS